MHNVSRGLSRVMHLSSAATALSERYLLKYLTVAYRTIRLVICDVIKQLRSVVTTLNHALGDYANVKIS